MSSRSFKFASLPLQVALYFNGWYLALFYVAEAFLLVYKALVLPYPGRNFGAEVVLLCFVALLDAIRIFLGSKGNLTERKLSLLLSLVFSLPVFFGYLYLTLWQTYVLRLELVFLGIAYLGLCLELPMGLITLLVFQRNEVVL